MLRGSWENVKHKMRYNTDMTNGSEIKNILERNWKEGKEELPALFENVEKIRKWTVAHGKRTHVYERTNAIVLFDELDLSLFPDTQIETRIDYIADEDEEVVEFPKRSAYSLSGDEIKVASFFLQEFVDEKKIHIV